MSTQYDDLYQASGADVEVPAKKRGCFFYGCITAVVLAVIAALVIGLGAYFAYQFVNTKGLEISEPIPTTMPPVELPEAERASVRDRFQAFRTAIDSGTPTEPLVLSAEEINALIEDNEDIRGKLHVDLEGDKIRGQVSIPLDFLSFFGLKGRYLNGVGVLKVALVNGILVVTVDSLEVKGKPVTGQFMDQLRNENIAKNYTQDPENAEQIRKLESIEVKDGKLIITPKAQPGADADMPAGDAAIETPKPDADPAKPDAEPAPDPAKPDAEPAPDPSKPDEPAPAPAPDPAKPDEPKLAA